MTFDNYKSYIISYFKRWDLGEHWQVWKEHIPDILNNTVHRFSSYQSALAAWVIFFDSCARVMSSWMFTSWFKWLVATILYLLYYGYFYTSMLQIQAILSSTTLTKDTAIYTEIKLVILFFKHINFRCFIKYHNWLLHTKN